MNFYSFLQVNFAFDRQELLTGLVDASENT
jgi:hypothetical protein